MDFKRIETTWIKIEINEIELTEFIAETLSN